jgi:hypothetical protein
MIRDVYPGSRGQKGTGSRTPDPGSGFATLFFNFYYGIWFQVEADCGAEFAGADQEPCHLANQWAQLTGGQCLPTPYLGTASLNQAFCTVQYSTVQVFRFCQSLKNFRRGLGSQEANKIVYICGPLAGGRSYSCCA